MTLLGCSRGTENSLELNKAGCSRFKTIIESLQVGAGIDEFRKCVLYHQVHPLKLAMEVCQL